MHTHVHTHARTNTRDLGHSGVLSQCHSVSVFPAMSVSVLIKLCDVILNFAPSFRFMTARLLADHSSFCSPLNDRGLGLRLGLSTRQEVTEKNMCLKNHCERPA